MVKVVLRWITHDFSLSCLDIVLVILCVMLELAESLVKVLFVSESPVEIEATVTMRLDVDNSKNYVREDIDLAVLNSRLNSNWQSLGSHIFVVVHTVG